VKTIIKSRIQGPSLLGLILLGLQLGAGDLKAQTSVSNTQTAVEGTQTPTAQDQKIQQLQDKLDEIQKELIDTPYATKFFSPEICSEVNYTYDFLHPQDDTNSGSSEVLSGFPL